MNLSVFELAQRLQNALDATYNVLDMGAVLEVLACLEGITVTKEQLETTRLAKFFNELRRKTADATLARRSKSLLKKWREMVIPTIPPPQRAPAPQPTPVDTIKNHSNHSNHSNPSNHAKTNGNSEKYLASVNNNSALPTTFSNLLASTPPKLGKRRAAGDSTPDQNGKRAKYVNGDATSIIVNSCSSDHSNSNSQNISVRVPKHKKHKKHKSREMVAPPPVVIQNQEPYLISDSLSDQSSSMSGFPTYGAATVQSSDKLNFTGCFGQNNNTVAFKSEEMARQSPFLPPSASNSPRFHSSLSNLDLFGAGSTTCNTSFRPKPVESRETSPRMVTPPLAVEPSITKSPPTASPRTPKKRGRKKGSKGIDSTLADASRFIGVDISHLSAPNSRTTSPAANFGNSYMDIKQKISLSGKKVKTTMELLAELQNRKTNSQEQFSNQVSPSSSSEMSLHSLKSHSAERSTVVTPELMRAQQIHLPNKPSTAADLLKDSLNPIEDEIRNLRAQLPPIDMSALDEEEVPPVDESGRNRICTCCFVEVEQEKEVDQIHVNIEKTENAEEKDQIMDVEDSNSDSDSDFCIVKEEPSVPQPSQKPNMKSIFDLDYDEDDAPAMDHRSSQTIQVEIHERRPAKKAITLTIPQDLPEFKVTEDAEPPAAPIITTWECVEDEECVAGQHQRQQGVCCAQDVELLHECYVEGLNGNWNGLPVDKCPVAPMFEPPCADIDYEKHSLYKRVVPSCNHLLMDKLPKVNASASEDRFSDTHSRLLSSFSELSAHHRTGLHSDSGVEFREWFELLNVPSFNDDTLTILPYVVID